MENIKFSEIDGNTVKKRHCRTDIGYIRIRTITALALLLLAALLAVGVGLIVHFISINKQSNGASTSSEAKVELNWPENAFKELVSESYIWEKCNKITKERKKCPNDCRFIEETKEEINTYAIRPNDVRLPNNTKPYHYNVKLTPFFYNGSNKDFYFDGVSKMFFQVVINSTNEIILHSADLDIINDETSVMHLKDHLQRPIAIINQTYDYQRQWFRVEVSEYLTVGEKYSIEHTFHGSLNTGLSGFYQSKYLDKTTNETRYLATTQFQPTDARRAFPCQDEPAKKATFNITLIHKQGYTALSTMDVLSEKDLEDDWVEVKFRQTPQMSTYLLAFIICDFKYKQVNTSHGVLLRIWSRADSIDQVDFAMNTSLKILEYFQDYFFIDYPLSKLDMIAVPDFSAGAMENWGLITYRETALLVDNDSSTASRQRVAAIISHELAHQWFGNIVTPSWWDDLWLNEGFASYVEYLGVSSCFPEWGMKKLFAIDEVQEVMRIDSYKKSHPIYTYVVHPEDIGELFDTISYAKGASVIRMMNSFIGEEIFLEGLIKYLNLYKYSVANHKNLWDVLTQVCRKHKKNLDVGKIMNTWIRQTGYPVVTLRRDEFGFKNILYAEQVRFLDFKDDLYNPKFKEYKLSTNWQISLTYRFDNSPAIQQVWMANKNVTLEVNEDVKWYLGNIKQFGFYRVNYDSRNWEAIVDQLLTNHTVFDSINRAQIIDDAFMLGRAGFIDQRIALQTTLYLKYETANDSYIPWKAAFHSLLFMDNMLKRTPAYGDFLAYLRDLITPVFEKFDSWTYKGTEEHLVKYLKGTAVEIACMVGLKKCREKALEEFDKWIDDENYKINADLLTIVLCIGIEKSNDSVWDAVFMRYLKATSLPNMQARLMYALSCSRHPWILVKYLSYTLDDKFIRTQDAIKVYESISKNPIGRDLAWDFVRKHWEDIIIKSSANLFYLTAIIIKTTETFNTRFELLQIEYFHKENPLKYTLAVPALNRAKERTISQMEWLDRTYDNIAKWLSEHRQSHW